MIVTLVYYNSLKEVKTILCDSCIPYSSVIRKFRCEKATPPRGPLVGDWIQRRETQMVTVYKLITIEFKWFGLQSKVESFIAGYEHRMFNLFHRKIFCSMNEWILLSLDDIR